MPPPRLPRLLLKLLAPGALRDDVVAEADEGYEILRAGGRRLRARLWYWRQVLSSDWLSLRFESRERRPRRRGRVEELMHSIGQDVRYALRSFARKPGFTAVVVVTLALGIGANVALVSVVRSVLLRPLPYGNEESLVNIWSQWTGFTKTWVSLGEYRYYRDALESFEDVALYYSDDANLTDGDDPERIGVAGVTVNLFDVVGVAPLLGRGFTKEEAKRDTADVVLLSHRLWQRRYGSDPRIVGRRIEIDGSPSTVLGILPAGFQLPIDFTAETRTDVYLPLDVPEGTEPIPTLGGSHGFYSLARLAKGSSLEAARAEVLASNLRETANGTYPEEWRFRTLVVPIAEDVVGNVRIALWVLLGAVGFVLLIACTNVANVVLSRSQERRRELALRGALGAGSKRVFRQLLTESVVLAALGGGLALLLAEGVLRVLVALEPGSIPRLGEARLDGGVLLVGLGVTLGTAVLFGAAPALTASRLNLRDVLHEGGRGAGGSVSSRRFRSALVALQMAMAVVLVVGAGLMIQSFRNLVAIDPGFRPEGVLTMRLAPYPSRYPESSDIIAFYDEVLERVRAIPGVEVAGAVRILPLRTQIGDWGTRIEGYEPPPGVNPSADWQVAGPGYVEAMGIPLLEGRTFTEADRADTEQVLLVNETFAKTYWPNESALGKRVRMGGADDPPWTRVVGVVGNVRHNGITAEIKGKWYRPQSQFHLSTGFTPRSMTLTIRSSLPAESLTPVVRQIVRDMDPKLPLSEVRPLEEVLASAVAPSRFTMALLVAFSALALVLATVGVYGVVSYIASQRKPEIGIRMALGANRASAVGVLGREVVPVTAAGVALGIGAAYLLTTSMGTVLHGVAPRDPLTFALVPFVLFAAALLGSSVPVLRAMRVDPASTLRAE